MEFRSHACKWVFFAVAAAFSGAGCVGEATLVRTIRVRSLAVGALYLQPEITIAFATQGTVFRSRFRPGVDVHTPQVLGAGGYARIWNLTPRAGILGTFFNGNGYTFGAFDITRARSLGNQGPIEWARYTSLGSGSTLGIERHAGQWPERFSLVLWDTDQKWKTLSEHHMPVAMGDATYLAATRWDQWAVLTSSPEGQTELLYKDGTVNSVHYGDYHARGQALGLWMEDAFLIDGTHPRISWIQYSENNAIVRVDLDRRRRAQSRDLLWPTDATCASIAWDDEGNPEALLLRTAPDGRRVAEYWQGDARVSVIPTDGDWETTCSLFAKSDGGREGRRLAAWSEGDWVRTVDPRTGETLGITSIPRDAD